MLQQPIDAGDLLTASRARGEALVRFEARKGGAGIAVSSDLQKLYQSDCAKVRFPKTHTPDAEAVLINTSGGLVGGDSLAWTIECGERTRCMVTTQACERVYRSSKDPAIVNTQINLGAESFCDWLPQETILFEKAALKRKLNVQMHKKAKFFAVEAILLGREAMGERLGKIEFSDRWRVHRSGALVHAEAVTLSGCCQTLLSNAAILGDAIAFASALYVGPEDEEVLRQRFNTFVKDQDSRVVAGSVFNNKIVLRIVERDGYHLRKVLKQLITHFSHSGKLPKVWST